MLFFVAFCFRDSYYLQRLSVHIQKASQPQCITKNIYKNLMRFNRNMVYNWQFVWIYVHFCVLCTKRDWIFAFLCIFKFHSIDTDKNGNKKSTIFFFCLSSSLANRNWSFHLFLAAINSWKLLYREKTNESTRISMFDIFSSKNDIKLILFNCLIAYLSIP